MVNFILFLWYVTSFIQFMFGYGTAYRLTKANGDNGVALWGWIFLMGWTSLIPGLGFYLWFRHRESDDE